MRKLLWAFAALAFLLAGSSVAQEKKAHPFRGTVEAVDQKNETLTVKHERVEGWMEAMTMAFEVDNPAVLSRVKPGDRVTATVYDGDMKLHDVKVAPAAKDSPKKP